MQGTGNDFIVLDNRDRKWSIAELAKLAPKICHRRFGIGADGILALEPGGAGIDYTMIYRNSDGSDAGMCGNGSRCLALYAHQIAGFQKEVRFRVHDFIYSARIDREEISITFPMTLHVDQPAVLADVEGSFTQTGNNHIIITEEAAQEKAGDHILELARKLRRNTSVAKGGSNVNIYRRESEDTLSLRTYECGVEDFTYACGTGAIATAVAAHSRERQNTVHQTYHIRSRGGTVSVNFDYDPAKNQYDNIQLIGPAEFICEGTYAW